MVEPLNENEENNDENDAEQAASFEEEIICNSIKAVAEELSGDGSNPAIKKAIDIINSVLAKGELYTDEDFPPTNDSLYRPEDNAQE